MPRRPRRESDPTVPHATRRTRPARSRDSVDPQPRPDIADDALAAPRPGPPQREWHLVRGKHWQIGGPRGEDPEITDARESNRGACPSGMVEVKGKMKVHAMIDELQMQTCTKWIDKKYPERCARVRPRPVARPSRRSCPRSPERLHGSLRVPEPQGRVPDHHGELPRGERRLHDRGQAPLRRGRVDVRLRGRGGEAVPYGYVRDHRGVPSMPVEQVRRLQALMPRRGPRAMAELDRLWQGVPSGARAALQEPVRASTT